VAAALLHSEPVGAFGHAEGEAAVQVGDVGRVVDLEGDELLDGQRAVRHRLDPGVVAVGPPGRLGMLSALLGEEGQRFS
jgi:hypothetical protein